MHPALRIGEADLMPETQAEVYAICRKFGLTHLIYVGFHTQICLLGKPINDQTIRAAQETLLAEATFRTSPARATAEYRRQLVVVLLKNALNTAWERAA